MDLMRTELLGLEKLPELPNEEKEKMSALGLGILEKPKPMLEGPHGKFEKSLFCSISSGKDSSGPLYSGSMVTFCLYSLESLSPSFPLWIALNAVDEVSVVIRFSAIYWYV